LAARGAGSVRVGAKVAQPGVVAAFKGPGAPGQVGPSHTQGRAWRKLGVGPRVRPGHDRRWEMTSGPHLAAAEAQMGRQWADGRAGPICGGVHGRTGCGVGGPPPDFDRWAPQANRKRGRKGFSIFGKKQSNQMNSNTNLNPNTQNNAAACMQ
jgi:hypothetical protein